LREDANEASTGDLNLDDLLREDENETAKKIIEMGSCLPEDGPEEKDTIPLDAVEPRAEGGAVLLNNFGSSESEKKQGGYTVGGTVWDRVLESMGGALPASQTSRIPLPAAIPHHPVPSTLETAPLLYQRPVTPLNIEIPAAEADVSQQKELDAVASAFFKMVHEFPVLSERSGASAATTKLFTLDERWDDLLKGITLPEEQNRNDAEDQRPSSELNQVLLTLGAAAAASDLVSARYAAVAELERLEDVGGKEKLVVGLAAPENPSLGSTQSFLSSAPSSSSISSESLNGSRAYTIMTRIDGSQRKGNGIGGREEQVEEEEGEEEEEEEGEDFLDRAALKAATAAAVINAKKNGIHGERSNVGESDGAHPQVEFFERGRSAFSKAILPLPSSASVSEEEEEEEEDVSTDAKSCLEADAIEGSSVLTAEDRDALDFTPDTDALIPRRFVAPLVGSETGNVLQGKEKSKTEVKAVTEEEQGEEEDYDDGAFTTRILISQNMKVRRPPQISPETIQSN